MADHKYRTTAAIPAYHWKLGKAWAYLKGRGISTIVSDVFQARVEANRDEIELMLKSRAKELGMTPDELMAKIMGDEPDDDE